MGLANLFFWCLFLALTFAGAGTPILAVDLAPRSDNTQTEREVAQFCYSQRQICRKICNLRSNFDDRFDGCPQSCETREIRCISTACFRWTEPDFLIAERFGGFRCAL